MRGHEAIRSPKIAVMGFSAGGHLASSLAVHFDRFQCDQDPLAATVSARPDAAVLCYPVINLSDEQVAHQGSRDALLGGSPRSELVMLMSTEQHVTAQTPPTFLWHTVQDQGVSVENSMLFAAACHRVGVPFEMRIYEEGVHGLGLALDRPDVSRWFEDCLMFLGRHLEA